MDLLIIGNGFDLAHQLPTRYTDFLRYCNNYSENDPISEFDELNKEFAFIIADNIWLKYFNNSTSDINNFQTWIDFEKEIGEIIHCLHILNPVVRKTFYTNSPSGVILDFQGNIEIPREFLSLISSFCEFDERYRRYVITAHGITDTNSFINSLYLQLRSFARAFEIYCLKINGTIIDNTIITTERKQRIEQVMHNINIYSQAYNSSIITNDRLRNKDLLDAENITRNSLTSDILPIDYLGMSKFNYVLSFNYTNTYERLYGNEGTKYCYIHGKAQDDAKKNNIILGIDDELSSGDESKNFKHVKFKKYYQRILFKTGSEYKDWLIPPANQNTIQHYVHIVGHSLDKTDHDILHEIFNKNHLKIIIYFHNQDDFEDKIKKVISLLAHKDGNGRDELIRRVHGSQWSIKFVDQYDEREGLFIRQENIF